MSTPNVTPQVEGPAYVYLNLGANGAFVQVGWTRDGVMFTPEAYWAEIKSDDNGGEGGPPTELEYLGETSRIRCEMIKYDYSNTLILETRLNGKWGYNNYPEVTGPGGGFVANGAVGQVGFPGTLVFANAFSFALAINYLGVNTFGAQQLTQSYPYWRVYPRCVPRHALEVNKGTKFSTFVAEFEAYRTAGGQLFWESSSAPSAYNL